MRKILFALLCMAGMTECMTAGGIDEPTDSYRYSGSSLTTSTSTTDFSCQNVGSEVKISRTGKPQVDVTINGIQFSSAMPLAVTFTARAIDCTYDEQTDKFAFSVSQVIPEIGGISREEFTMSNFAGTFDDLAFALDFDITMGGVAYHVRYDGTVVR